jgi:hypothetical protein
MADQSTKTDYSKEAAAADNYTPSPTESPDKPDFFQQVMKAFQRPKKTGAYCEYCDWSGPNCMRNGGIVIYD